MSNVHRYLPDVTSPSRLPGDPGFPHHGTTSTANSYLRRQEFTASSSEETTSDTDTSSASTTSSADAKPAMINAPAQIGLIMPNPGPNVYTGEHLPSFLPSCKLSLILNHSYPGVEYRLGYVDPGPAPRVDGVLRVVTPLLTYPNHTVSILVQPRRFTA